MEALVFIGGGLFVIVGVVIGAVIGSVATHVGKKGEGE